MIAKNMQIRLLKHSAHALFLIGIPFLYYYIIEQLNEDKGDPMFIGITVLFFLINTFRLTKDYKINACLSTFLAVLIIISSYFITFFLIKLDFLLPNDPFAIISMIIYNSILSVVLFEIFFFIKA
jgi:hypothetical protein